MEWNFNEILVSTKGAKTGFGKLKQQQQQLIYHSGLGPYKGP